MFNSKVFLSDIISAVIVLIKQSAAENPLNQKLVEKVKEIATKKDVTPSQVALVWVLAKGSDIAAIPGTRRSKYLNLNWATQVIILSKKEKAELDAFSQNFKVVGERY